MTPGSRCASGRACVKAAELSGQDAALLARQPDRRHRGRRRAATRSLSTARARELASTAAHLSLRPQSHRAARPAARRRRRPAREVVVLPVGRRFRSASGRGKRIPRRARRSGPRGRSAPTPGRGLRLVEPDRQPRAGSAGSGRARARSGSDSGAARVLGIPRGPGATGRAVRFRSTPRPFCAGPGACPSGFRFGTIQRSARAGARSSARTTAIPAHSLPWMQPTTSTVVRALLPRSSTRGSGAPCADVPNVPLHIDPRRPRPGRDRGAPRSVSVSAQHEPLPTRERPCAARRSRGRRRPGGAVRGGGRTPIDPPSASVTRSQLPSGRRRARRAARPAEDDATVDEDLARACTAARDRRARRAGRARRSRRRRDTTSSLPFRTSATLSGETASRARRPARPGERAARPGAAVCAGGGCAPRLSGSEVAPRPQRVGVGDGRRASPAARAGQRHAAAGSPPAWSRVPRADPAAHDVQPTSLWDGRDVPKMSNRAYPAPGGEPGAQVGQSVQRTWPFSSSAALSSSAGVATTYRPNGDRSGVVASRGGSASRAVAGDDPGAGGRSRRAAVPAVGAARRAPDAACSTPTAHDGASRGPSVRVSSLRLRQKRQPAMHATMGRARRRRPRGAGSRSRETRLRTISQVRSSAAARRRVPVVQRGRLELVSPGARGACRDRAAGVSSRVPRGRSRSCAISPGVYSKQVTEDDDGAFEGSSAEIPRRRSPSSTTPEWRRRHALLRRAGRAHAFTQQQTSGPARGSNRPVETERSDAAMARTDGYVSKR